MTDLRLIRDFQRFKRELAQFFLRRQFVEVETPSLVPCPGLEPTLDPFEVMSPVKPQSQRLFLPTSPEIHLKMAMVWRMGDIFEMKPCFRAGEVSSHHQPEFTMLEWYRIHKDLKQIRLDIQDMVQELARTFAFSCPTWEEARWSELFHEAFGFSLRPTTTYEELCELCRRQQLYFTTADSWNDLFHRLVIEFIEPSLIKRGAVFVRDFPPSQAALAKINHEGWAERMELYWSGLEIANAFFEVVSAEEQAQRWQAETDERVRGGRAALPWDERLIVALQEGLEPCSGVALGVERLFMAAKGISQIQSLKLFPWTH